MGNESPLSLTGVERKERRRKTVPWYLIARIVVQTAFAALSSLAIVGMDFTMLIALLGLALLSGAWFCGWLCPLGTAQEWIGRLGKRLFRFRLRMPPMIERYASWLRFVLLALSLAGIGWLGFLSEPYRSFMGLIAGHTAYIEAASWVLLGLFLALSLLVDRPFCRYLCVDGAQHGAVSLARLFTVRRDPARCTGCKACDRACPTQVAVSRRSHVRSAKCVNCLECLNACPRPGALTFGFFHRKSAGTTPAGDKKETHHAIEE